MATVVGRGGTVGTFLVAGCADAPASTHSAAVPKAKRPKASRLPQMAFHILPPKATARETEPSLGPAQVDADDGRSV